MYARSKTGAGFTIVEVLIVLAISGLMFVLAINAMSGQQQNTEFQTGLGTLRSQLNADLSNVSDGNYGFLNGLSCSAGATGVPSYNVSNATGPDGSCTVVGELLAFNTKSYEVLPVIGRNYISGSTTNQVATTIAQAMPQVSGSEEQTTQMPFGLEVANVPSASIYSPSGPGALGLFSFTSFEGNSSGTGLATGAEHVEIFMIPSSTFNNSAGTIGIVNAGLTDDKTVCGANNVCTASPPITSEPIDPTSGITFCVNSGTNNFSALFTIGGPNSATSASDKIYSNPDCT